MRRTWLASSLTDPSPNRVGFGRGGGRVAHNGTNAFDPHYAREGYTGRMALAGVHL
jgi:hypothetical protein